MDSLKGGAKWEAIVNPDWNRYFFHRANKDSGEIASSDRDLIEEILSKDSLLHDWTLVEGTEQWEILEPWEATYWKTLPQGYRVQYQTFDNRDRNERRHGNPEFAPSPLITMSHLNSRKLVTKIRLTNILTMRKVV